eukprot:TRINITY_DN8783_c0_g1_i1.p1 TRINITY_DN8783_c0_g1~~TRINITY_DN8783_c0_g1_i1.p1  ORF type:complete len:313 (+),score=96.24 TRINITY_DN8783_c0_g1_i1:45-983(+)
MEGGVSDLTSSPDGWVPRSASSAEGGGWAPRAAAGSESESESEPEPEPLVAPASLVRHLSADAGGAPRQRDGGGAPRQRDGGGRTLPPPPPRERPASCPPRPPATSRGLGALRERAAMKRQAAFWEGRVRMLRVEVAKAAEGIGRVHVADEARQRADQRRAESSTAADGLRRQKLRERRLKEEAARAARSYRIDSMRETRLSVLRERRVVCEEQRREQLRQADMQAEFVRRQMESRLRMCGRRHQTEAEGLVRRLQRKVQREEAATLRYEQRVMECISESDRLKREAAKSVADVAELTRELTLARQRKVALR